MECDIQFAHYVAVHFVLEGTTRKKGALHWPQVTMHVNDPIATPIVESSII